MSPHYNTLTMNNQIQNLLNICGMPNEHLMAIYNDTAQTVYMEKFAHLIINKCVVVSNYAHDGGEYPGPMIREYFGVEE